MPRYDFEFNSEFSLLDIGVTGALLRTGSLRASLLLYSDSGIEAIVLNSLSRPGLLHVVEEARKHARDAEPIAYGLICRVMSPETQNFDQTWLLAGEESAPGAEFVCLALADSNGAYRTAVYPVRRSPRGPFLDAPRIDDIIAPWNPFGDIWNNPYCSGDLVKFRHRERAVDPGGRLWQCIVDLTKLRLAEDQSNADDYMLFLDDLRNGLFVVDSRAGDNSHEVILRPRTEFNPLGRLRSHASRLQLAETTDAATREVKAS